MGKEKICVYTCVTGTYDIVKDPWVQEGIDYILFTNNKRITSCKWNVIYIEDENLDNIRLARKIKILGHPYLKKYDISIWMDASCYINVSIAHFIYDICEILKYDMVSFKHSVRDCIYEEGYACLACGKGEPSLIYKQLERYKNEGYPTHNGLIESPILVRWHRKKEVKELMKYWFKEIKNESSRDQLSFNYCLHHHPIRLLLLDENVFDCPYFVWMNHLNTCFSKGKVYFDEGSGFSEKNSMSILYKNKKEKMYATIEIPKDIQNLRIDLEEAMGFSIEHLVISGIDLKTVQFINYISVNEALVFETLDPILLLNRPFEKGEKLEISFHVRKSNYDELIWVNRSLYFKEMIQIQNLKNMKKQLEIEEEKGKMESDRVQYLEREYDRLALQMKKILNSKSWRITAPLRAIKNKRKK